MQGSDAAATAVAQAIGEALDEGLTLDDIAIISLAGRDDSLLGPAPTRVGSYRLRRFTGEYRGTEQVYSDGDVRFDSITRFKGQHAPWVILLDGDVVASLQAARLYCGLTRATYAVRIVAATGGWAAEALKEPEIATAAVDM